MAGYQVGQTPWHPVAGRVAMGVIDHFEMIYFDQQYGRRLGSTLAPVYQFLKIGQQITPVAEAK